MVEPVENKAWTRYMSSTGGADNDKMIAAKVGVSPSTISRWRSGDVDPKPRQVVAFARAYEKSALLALVAAGYLDASDLGEEVALTMGQNLDEVSTATLVSELQERLTSIDEFLSWVEELGGGRPSTAGLGLDALRYIRPGTAPSDVDPRIYIRALGDSLEQQDVQGVPVYRPAPNVSGVTEDADPRHQSDYDLVSHPYTDETGELMDE